MADSLMRYSRHLRAQGYALNTVRVKVKVVQQVAAAGGVDPVELTADHVEAYFDRPLAAWSRRKYVEHLRAFARWAGITDPTAGVRSPRRPSGVPKPVSEQQLAILMRHATPRTRAFLVLGAYAGLRAFEIAKLRGDDFETTPAGPALRVRGKGDRLDVIPVPTIVGRELRPWRDRAGPGPLWPGLTSAAVQSAVKRLGRTAGVPVTCHQLRHRYGTQLYAASHDLLTVQRLMRHSSPTTTAGYAQVVDEVGQRLVDLLPVPVVVTDRPRLWRSDEQGGERAHQRRDGEVERVRRGALKRGEQDDAGQRQDQRSA